MTRGQRRRGGGPGFSLLEVLIVIGVITFLMAAIVVVLPRVSNSSKVAATKATIQKVDRLLDDRLNGFKRYITTQDRLAGASTPSYVIQTGMLAQFPGNPALARVMAIKQTFMINFPQRFSEMSTPPSFNPAVHRPETESAACLYLILTRAAVFDTEPPSGAELKASEVADTDGDGLPEIIDAWGHPLRFYRCPTRLVRPAPSPGSVSTPGVYPFVEVVPSPTSLAVTGAPRGPLPQWAASTVYSIGSTVRPMTPPGGPLVLVFQCTAAVSPGQSGATEPAWPNTAGATVADGNLTWQAVLDPLSVDPDDPGGIVPANVMTEANSYRETPNTWHVPLIISSGPDETLGLFEPSDSNNFGDLCQPQFDASDLSGFLRNAMVDNITNQQK